MSHGCFSPFFQRRCRKTGTAHPEQVSQRRELIQAAKTINASGVLGDQKDLVFVVDPTTHRAIMRVVDHETQEVLMQLPPEYVLHLAEDLAKPNR